MIELRTGLPGSGKTLSMVHELFKLQARWEKHPAEARPVFVHNIKELALPHSQLPMKQWEESRGVFRLVPDWESMPEGSLVLSDECQDIFPPRSSQQRPPEHVAFLNTHRHRGFDIWVTTQHPRLIDSSLRALVGKHMHHRRLFGAKRAVVYEWDSCSDSLSGTAHAVKSYFEFPAKAYQYYKSAEIHTKQKFRLPLWLGIPVIGILMCAVFFPRMFHTLHNGISGKPIVDHESVVAASAMPQELAAASGVGGAIAPTTRAQLLPVAQVQAPRFVPRLGACVMSETSCKCYTPHGAVVPLSLQECRENALNVTDRYQLDSPQNQYELSQPTLPPQADGLRETSL